ncbi:MAG: WD40 repeat domain-containing protein [Spirulina sp.]
MESWLNLFFKVAFPVFKTLVYAGTNNVLSGLQDELKSQQKQQTKYFLKNLGMGKKSELVHESLTFEEQSDELGDRTSLAVQKLVQDFSQHITEARLDSQDRQFDRGKVLQHQLFFEKQKVLLKLASYQRETTLSLPEVQQSFDQWPLRIFPCQLLESYPTSQPLPLRIFLAPPQISLARFETKIEAAKMETERRLAQEIRQFLQQHYSLQNPLRPTEFLGGAWKGKNFHGEASIKALFWMLKSEPTLILESEIEGNYLNFRIAYWGLGQQQYFYATLFQLSYREFLEEIAKKRALQWKKSRDKLLKSGKDAEAIARLGGAKAINLELLEEIEELEKMGVDIQALSFPFQITHEDLESLLRFLSLCHCLVAGWVTDIHYLIHNDIPPLLPEFLPQLLEEYSEEYSDLTLLETTVAIYREVLLSLSQERPYWIPELALKLAKSLSYLPERSFARQQVQYSLQMWLQQHHLSPLTGIQELEKIQSAFTCQDRDYLVMLQECLLLLGDRDGVSQLERILGQLIDTKQPKSSIPSLHFSLAYPLTSTSTVATGLLTTADGQRLVSLGDRSAIEIWTLTGGKPILTQKLTHASRQVLAVALSADGQTLASSDLTSQRSPIKLWNLATGKLQQTLFGHKKPVISLLMSPDGQTLMSASHKIKLWNLTNGESRQTLFGHKEWVTSLAINDAGDILVSGSEDKSVRIWDVSTGELMYTLTGHQGKVNAVAITPDGEIAISGSEDSTLKFWEVKTGKLLQTLTDHSGAVNAIAIASDGQHLISGSDDATLKIWHIPSRQWVQTLTKHTAAVTAIALSFDRQTLFSSSQDRAIAVWRSCNLLQG